MPHSDSESPPTNQSQVRPKETYDDDMIDLRQIALRLGRGFSMTLGLALLGLVIALIIYLSTNRFMPAVTSGRVTFSFKGFDHGLYPDNSKFQADDLLAPDLVAEAIKHLSMENSETFQGKIRGGINVEGIVPAEVVKQRRAEARSINHRQRAGW